MTGSAGGEIHGQSWLRAVGRETVWVNQDRDGGYAVFRDKALTVRVRRTGYVPVTVAGEVDIATVHRLQERLNGVTGDGRERDGTPAGAVRRGQGNYGGNVPGMIGRSTRDRPGAVGTVWLRVVRATRQFPGFTSGLKINSMLIGGG
jgi:hypothetical protein